MQKKKQERSTSIAFHVAFHRNTTYTHALVFASKRVVFTLQIIHIMHLRSMHLYMYNAHVFQIRITAALNVNIINILML